MGSKSNHGIHCGFTPENLDFIINGYFRQLGTCAYGDCEGNGWSLDSD
jgi:hypothetical protein